MIHAPGTHCSLIPPVGFVIADRFTGFQNNSTGSSIMITELAGKYEAIIPEITPEALAKQRMTVTKTEKIQFNGSEATLFSATQSQSGSEFQKLIFIFGSGSQTIMINGIFPTIYKDLEPVIRKSILTTKYLENGYTELDGLFSINTSGTNYKIVSKYGTSLVYSSDSTLVPGSPKFIVSNSVDKISKENRKKYAESRIMKLPRGDQNTIISTTPISIDGLDGYEIIAEGLSLSDKKQKIYEVILYNVEGDYYIMIGTASDEIEKNIKIFKQLANTFTLRES